LVSGCGALAVMYSSRLLCFLGWVLSIAWQGYAQN
jgi:hypothetical protein